MKTGLVQQIDLQTLYFFLRALPSNTRTRPTVCSAVCAYDGTIYNTRPGPGPKKGILANTTDVRATMMANRPQCRCSRL